MTKILTAIAVLALAVGIAAIAGVRTYGLTGEARNAGITWGSCGFEFWGDEGPGHFCDAD